MSHEEAGAADDRASEPPESSHPTASGAEEGEASVLDAHPRRMLDRYEIIAEIARGGMGTVLLARLAGAGGFERLMAIKLMHEHLAQDASFVTMLLDEARTAANIVHPNAVGIVDVAQSRLGYYLVMSYVEGFTLADVIGHPDLEPRQRIRLGLRLLLDACHGLHAAHTTKDARGTPLHIVHRDVSPQNVLVGLDGVGRIVDFGIALAASRMSASRSGVLKGKPSYMAPEQVKSEPCDARADVFALGIILWEILIGRRLFQAELDLATLVQVMDSPIPRPATIQPLVTESIDRVAMKALERDLKARYRTARQLARELESAAGEAGLLASAHEVADAIGELFADQIAAKQEAIRHHLASSSGEEKPIEPGQLGLVPKLYDVGPSPRSAEVIGKSTQSGVRDRGSGAIDPHARTGYGLQNSSPSRTKPLRTPGSVPPAESELATPGALVRRPPRWLLGVALLVVGLAVGSATFWWDGASESPNGDGASLQDLTDAPGPARARVTTRGDALDTAATPSGRAEEAESQPNSERRSEDRPSRETREGLVGPESSQPMGGDGRPRPAADADPDESTGETPERATIVETRATTPSAAPRSGSRREETPHTGTPHTGTPHTGTHRRRTPAQEPSGPALEQNPYLSR